MAADTTSLIEETRRRVPDLGNDIELAPILKGGSNRRYFRIHHSCGSPSGAILMAYEIDRPDNAKFLPTTRILESYGVSVQAILAEDTESRLIWLQDIGTRDLNSYQSESWPERKALYLSTIEEASKIHSVSEGMLSAEQSTLLAPHFDAALYRWEQDYFFAHFVGQFTDLSDQEIETLKNSEMLSSLANRLSELPRTLVHRDFQSENVLVKEGKIYLIDYQGLRLGRPEYDLASLIYDPYVELSPEEIGELITHCETLPFVEDAKAFRTNLAMSAGQRLMQALGAYGNLSLNLGKTQYTEFMRPALRNLALATASIPELSDLGSLQNRLR